MKIEINPEIKKTKEFDGRLVERSISSFIQKSNFPKKLFLNNVIKEIKMNIQNIKISNEKIKEADKQILTVKHNIEVLKQTNKKRIHMLLASLK